jgi:hypothetical protein
MAFLGNRTVNLLNLHYGLHSLAMALGGVFFGVYLLKAGLTLPQVLLAMAAILMGRFLIRPLVLPLGKRIGLRGVLIAGSLASAIQYPMLAMVSGMGSMLVATLAVSSLGETLYWTSYHAYFAQAGDAEHRGKHISVREAAAQVVGVIGPVVGGWALATLGPMWAFGFAGLAQAGAALPLFGTPKVEVPATAEGGFAATRAGVMFFAADGFLASGFYWAWQFALFQGLGESFTAYGGALALAAVAGAIIGLFHGHNIDAGDGRRAVPIAFAAVAGTTLIRALAATPGAHPAIFLTANALGALVAGLYTPTLMTAVYNLSQAAPCQLRFHIASEGGFDIGCAAGLVLAAGLLTFGAPISLTVLQGVLGAVGTGLLMRRYYARA